MEDTKNQSTQPIPNPPSVGTRNKESGSSAQIETVSERPVISPDLSKYVQSSEPEVPSDAKVGIKPAGPSSNVNEQPVAKLHMSDAEIEARLKSGAGSDFDVQKSLVDKIYFVSADFCRAMVLNHVKKVIGFRDKLLKPRQTQQV